MIFQPPLIKDENPKGHLGSSMKAEKIRQHHSKKNEMKEPHLMVEELNPTDTLRTVCLNVEVSAFIHFLTVERPERHHASNLSDEWRWREDELDEQMRSGATTATANHGSIWIPTAEQK